LGAAVVQGGLVRKIIPALGERRTLLLGILVSIAAYLFYGSAPRGWMLYAALPVFALGGIGGPAAQSMMSKAMPPNEQGLLQGALASLQSITGFIGPMMATWLFGYFISDQAPFALPGAPFFQSALLALAGFGATLFAFSRHAAPEQVGELAPPAGETS
jgi:DHA1 family tetracycline resistance protein-like MFS transporter